jgi:ribosomal protein L12E/L44/L45/RPP1/RPP2
MKRVLVMISIACVGMFASACEDKKEPTPPVASATATPTAAPMATPSATVAATAAPSSVKQADSDEPDDTEEETATSDITADNFEKELDGLEKEVNSKY